jgi:hypothetical protein
MKTGWVNMEEEGSCDGEGMYEYDKGARTATATAI